MIQKGLILILFCWAPSAFSQIHNNELVSGTPIKHGGGDGIGPLAMPCLTGMIMGTALINEDTSPDLFIQADKGHPGIYLYYFRKFTRQGEPVFSEPIKVKTPFEDKKVANGIILQSADKTIYGFWRFSSTLKFAEFNKKTDQFGNFNTIRINGLPRSFSSFGVLQTADNRYLFLFTVAKAGVFGDPARGPDSSYYTPEGFWPYDLPETGIYGAVADRLDNISRLDARPLTGLKEALFGISGYALLQNKNETYIICGTRLGNILAYKLDPDAGAFPQKNYIVDSNGTLQRHPTVNSFPAYFKIPGSREGLVASGEGGIYFYENTGQINKQGNLVFKSPSSLLQEKPVLYGGSLVVPDLVDWDGDNVTDIISGTSPGTILFFKNAGTNERPAFLSPLALKAGDYTIHVQPGYREDIQGPGEARWGYTCPTVYDWNGDGLPDILTGDSRGKFMVYINRGTKTKPRLMPERSLYLKGMDMFGGWRVKPGVGKLDGKTAYIILDKENELHLYWHLDDYNVTDGGKLRLTDGSFIKANRRPGGQVGRIKIHMVDWDEDGRKDLLIGTGRGASIPNPVNGLPYNRQKKNEGASILFLKNTGTEAKPVFEFPKMMKFRGAEILLGAHACSPTTAFIGTGNTLNLVVGTETGNYIFYERKDLSW